MRVPAVSELTRTFGAGKFQRAPPAIQRLHRSMVFGNRVRDKFWDCTQNVVVKSAKRTLLLPRVCVNAKVVEESTTPIEKSREKSRVFPLTGYRNRIRHTCSRNRIY
jgi:hypothetical protein